MPTYITLMSYTQEGIEHVKDGPARLDAAKAAAKAGGGEIKAFYLVMGRYDAVIISEAPSDEAFAATTLAIAATGAIRTETLKAFPEADYRKIISSLP